MKIAVTSTGPTLDHQVEARFGRCAYFLIVDPDTMEFEGIENPNIALGGGAGIQSAQLLAQRGVQTVLTGNCGPNAFQTFGAAGIQVIVGVSGPVKEAVEKFKSGVFSAASGPSVDSKFGLSGGAAGKQAAQQSPQPIMPGPGMGRGMGRGMAGAPMTTPPSQMTKEQELDMLKQQARAVAEQLEEIQKRIAELEKKK